MHKVIINGKTEYAPHGTLLSDILIESGKGAEHLCGGKGICRKCTVTVNGKPELSCRYRVISDITVSFDEKGEIQSETGEYQAASTTNNVCYALDIGTTTLALALVSLDENKIIKVTTRTNPQVSFGADVMSRIEHCTKHGVEKLQKTVINEINSMIIELGVSAEKMYVSGNTTMLHLFFGVNCSAMGVAPYTPSFLKSQTVKAESIGISGIKTVESLPMVDAFVGADIVAGLNLIGMPTKGRHSLLVDLGTNAEIVLFDENSALCTSAAAGPCFEGANISCGMSATEGAVYACDGAKIKTVGNAPAKGICGTGLIDTIAHFIRSGAVDQTGFMADECIEIAENVSVTQEDVRQYQLAKSAVYSAIITLMKMKNVEFDEIEILYISGGFSAKINAENAALTGLLPQELTSVCTAINNSSLLGTVKYAAEKNELCTDKITYVDLSASAVFSDLFIDNMMF
ncbi:MAG: DUF4445 domain-containing protein [Clostridia bacterium]|nr:DUF4445 domain-containing protein [Clostridia bacterium]